MRREVVWPRAAGVMQDLGGNNEINSSMYCYASDCIRDDSCATRGRHHKTETHGDAR